MRERFALRPAGDALRQAEVRRAGLADAPSAGRNARRRGRRAGHENPARLSADRGPAAVADAEDRPRGAGNLRRTCSTRSFPTSICRATTSGRCSRRCRRSIFPTTRRAWTAPGGGWCTRSCLILQLALAVRRQQQHDQRTAPALEATAKIDARIRRLFPFELTAGPGASDRRDRRRHGRPAADEPAVAGRRGQRQDGGGRLRHAAGRGPRIPGRADGPHRSARPATRPDARAHAGRQPGPPGAIDRRPDARVSGRRCCN